MVESKECEETIMLGFIEKPPTNSLITQAMCVPSKIGGTPAWIATKGIPNTSCNECKTQLCFIAQLYANLDALEEFHRMLYVFACVSEQCIGKPNCVRVFRALVQDKNPMVKFLSDTEFNQIANKTDEVLMTSKFAHYYDNLEDFEDEENQEEEIVEEQKKEETNDVILKEFIIESEEENYKVTQMSIQHARRIIST